MDATVDGIHPQAATAGSDRPFNALGADGTLDGEIAFNPAIGSGDSKVVLRAAGRSSSKFPLTVSNFAVSCQSALPMRAVMEPLTVSAVAQPAVEM